MTTPTGRPADTATDPVWWRDAVVYQIYPRSFADADGDGIGDLRGITDHLPALADLGVDAIWLSPFYRSPQADAGYDVADYRDVDPLFGTLADFDALRLRAHELGLKVIVDLVPNHSSSDHRWFRAALAALSGSPERDRYIFRDGCGPGGDQPPNNWRSVFGGPAWTRLPDGQWYLHLFDPGQPDFNWDNPEVRAEFIDTLRFWLDRGVDGFRVDVAHGLVKVEGLPDEDPVQPAGGAMNLLAAEAAAHAAGTPEHPAWDQDGVHEIYRSWHKVLEEYSPQRILVAEAWVYPQHRVARYVRPDEMQQAFNFEFLTCPWNPMRLRRVIDDSLRASQSVGAPTTWVLSNHDVVRHASRFGLADDAEQPNGIGIGDPQPDAAIGLARARAATLNMLGLPGSAYLYQGEELGLPGHTMLPDELRQDPTWRRSGYTERGRDGCRVPLPWRAGAPALGFSPTGASWLPQPAAFGPLARDLQAGDPGSTLSLYRTALGLRRHFALGAGELSWDPALTEGDVLAYRNSGVLVVFNMGRPAVPLPPGRVLVASGPLHSNRALPGTTAVWLRPLG